MDSPDQAVYNEAGKGQSTSSSNSSSGILWAGSDAVPVGRGSSSYKVPEGGGGITDKIKIRDMEVSFGHGGRHLAGTNLSTEEVNQAIAKDIIAKNKRAGQFYKGRINIKGIEIEYTSYVVEDGFINIGTYYPV